MDVAVMGAGGVGGYFGGMLARAGDNVTLVARGEHLDAIRRDGLRVIHQGGEFTVAAHATDDPASIGPVELVLFTVKAYDTGPAVESIRPLVGPQTTVLTLQNGVDSYRVLGEALGEGRVLPGAAYIEGRIQSPGVVAQSGHIARIALGEADGSRTDRVRRIHAALTGAGITAEASPDVLQVLWTKFIFIAAVAGITSVCRARIGELLDKPGYRGLLVDCMREIESVGRAAGVNLPADVVPQTLRYVEGSVKDITASMHLDLERGRRLELEIFNGSVVRQGEALGVPTPVNRTLYLALKPFAGGAPPPRHSGP